MNKKSLSYIVPSILVSALLVTEAQALELVRKLYVGEEQSVSIFKPDFSGGQFGSQITAGDFNADGFDDLAISSPYASTDGHEWNGVVNIHWGGELSKNDKATIIGDSSGDQLGSSISAGDFNGDGVDDLAIGAYNAFKADSRTGKVYIINGVQSPDTQVASQLMSRNLTLEEAEKELASSNVNGALFGLSTHAGSLNGDSFDDLLVGAPATLNKDGESVGAVYAYMGSEKGLSRFSKKIVYGPNEGEMFGASLGYGYFNGDRETDLVVGAYTADKNNFKDSGVVYYYENFLNELRGKYVSKTFAGAVANEWFGFALEVGDMNADGLDDVLMSSYPYRGPKSVSKVSSYFGGQEFYNLFSDVTINGSEGNSLIGSSIIFEDINGDGYKDIITGAPSVGKIDGAESGKVYIKYGSADGFESLYSVKKNEVDSAIYGQQVDDWFGYSIESLDFNADGWMDLAIGARYSDGENSVNNGSVYLIYGNGGIIGDYSSSFRLKDETVVNRGEFISKVVDSFNLESEKATYVDNCYAYLEFCLFNFMASSRYDDIQLDPELILYPDVQPDHEHYSAINLATLMGVVNGFSAESQSPFHPEFSVSRIQALKIILGATDLVRPKYRFELAEDLGGDDAVYAQESYFEDIRPVIEHMWWYPRYANFSADIGIIDKGGNFRPDDLITASELDELIERTVEYLNIGNEETES